MENLDANPIFSRWLKWKATDGFAQTRNAHEDDLQAAWYAGSRAMLEMLTSVADLPVNAATGQIAAARSEAEEEFQLRMRMVRSRERERER